ncbi:MAG TPA: class I SAM-dependent methyltransferase [Thermoguttaceae bacterium]
MVFLQDIYIKLKKSYFSEIGYVVPLRYQSGFVHFGGGAEVQFIYKEFLKDLSKGSKILIIGVMGGRDYFFLKYLGFDVVAVDIGKQPDIDPIIMCNVEEELPFESDSFDAVLVGEVLEHLKNDVQALINIRRVLKKNGILIVSLPFYNDWEEGHMRIHSPESGKRLMRMGGFTIKNYLERPGILWINSFNLFQHGLSYLKYLITKKTAYSFLINSFGKGEWVLGHIMLFRPIRRFSKHYGGYYLCYKDDIFDHLKVNKNLYTS